MSMDEIVADIEWQSGDESEGPEFPEGFSGAGPMFAAVPVGEPWLKAATEGATTYILHDPYSFPGPEEQAQQLHERYAGYSAFLDRHQAEQVADHPGRSGEFYRWEGLTGYHDWSEKAEARFEASRNPESGWPRDPEAS